jgi:alpha-glucosidase
VLSLTANQQSYLKSVRKSSRKPSRKSAFAAFAFVVGTAALAAPAAHAGWTSVTTLSTPQRQGQSVVFRSGQGTLAITAVTPQVVRFRYGLGPALGRDHSYAVVAGNQPVSPLGLQSAADHSTLTTKDLRITVRHNPMHITVADAAGEVLDQDDERGLAFSGKSWRLWKRLPLDQHVYGFGEKNGPLDKRGANRGGSNYSMWNTDTYAYERETDPTYVSVPYYMALRKGRAFGIYLDNTHRSSFDVGREFNGVLSFGAEGGDVDYYFIAGPTPKEVVQRYTALTGRMPLPPLWSLGYHQCRYSYWPDTRVREIATGFRKRKIPLDVMWLDIHHLDGYAPFTWDPKTFPDPAGLISDLRKQGIRMVNIVDPHIKVQKGTVPYDSGIAGNHFIRAANGSVYEGPVWPAKAEKDPANSVFPDFTRPATRAWWGDLYRPLLDLGMAGIWNDMNEPSVFDPPTGTMPNTNRHDNDGQPTDHAAVHNVYGMQMARATFEGLSRLRPNDRPFVLTRATFAGGQRHAAVWTGDAQSDWSHLRGSLPMLMNLGLSGFAFVGSDIGGFSGGPSAELFTRWLQASVFAPFMRTHAELGTPDKEPWSFGPKVEALAKRAIELRYELLPYIYNVMKEASETGVPAMRPLFLEFPGDGRFYSRDTEFLFGPSLLVAPVLREGVKTREVQLPAGIWYDFWTGAEHKGGKTITVPVTLASLPMFVRGGGFLFRQSVVQHSGEVAKTPMQIDVYPAATESRVRLYEDDGTTMAYTKGGFRQRTLVQRTVDGVHVIELGAVEGTQAAPTRRLLVRVRTPQKPRAVKLGDAALAASTRVDRPGWSWSRDGWTNVTLDDSPAAARLAIEPVAK